MQAGSFISVIYHGEVAESYPAQLSTVLAIYPIDEHGTVLNEVTE